MFWAVNIECLLAVSDVISVSLLKETQGGSNHPGILKLKEFCSVNFTVKLQTKVFSLQKENPFKTIFLRKDILKRISIEG